MRRMVGTSRTESGGGASAAERAVDGATRESDVIARIRSLIRKGAAEREQVDLKKLIEAMTALAGAQASRNAVSIMTEFAADLSSVTADKIQLQQVLANLTMNAIEAMSGAMSHQRELTIRLNAEEMGQVLVSFEGSGIGIPPEVMARLFEPFFTTQAQGIGMGLAISRSIIEAHGGRLWAESTPIQGATFHFTLPGRSGVDA